MARSGASGGIATQLEGIAHLLRDEPLAVPSYQRDFSWGIDQVDAFWQDLRAALVAEQPLYFLGTVVLSDSESDRSIVIDGQQRLATTSMLLAAIRNAYRARDDVDRANLIDSRYALTTSLTSAQREPRLYLNTHDREFFEGYVLHSPATLTAGDAARASHQLIADAFQRLQENLETDLQAAGPHWSQRLEAWVRLLDADARVIAVRVQDDADAFLIFETLNDRGLALTIADVIKNYLFGLARDNLDLAERHWADMNQSLEDVAAALGTTTFLRQWWSAQHGATRERELYRSVRTSVRQAPEALDALDSFRAAAPLFAAALDARHERWGSYPPAAQPAMETLLRLGLEQYRPLLLAGLARLPEAEVPHLIESLVCWSVRGLVAGGIGGGTTERYYAEAAVRVFRRRVQDVEGVLKDLESVVATDEEFRAAFASRRGLRLGLAKYLLVALANEREGVVPSAVVPESRDQDLAVVRLLPNGAPHDWAEVLTTDDDAGALASRIGNLFLLDRRLARRLPMDRSGRLQAVAEGDRWGQIDPSTNIWTRTEIETRQARLAEQAVIVWPRLPARR